MAVRPCLPGSLDQKVCLHLGIQINRQIQRRTRPEEPATFALGEVDLGRQVVILFAVGSHGAHPYLSSYHSGSRTRKSSRHVLVLPALAAGGLTRRNDAHPGAAREGVSGATADQAVTERPILIL